MVIEEAIRIDYISHRTLQDRGITLGILRLDLVHPVVSGNKWFKLKENIHTALSQGYDTVLTFGGAWSNHLVATAAAAQAAGLKAIGMVRGLHADAATSATLQECRDLGMQLQPLSREDYNRKEDAVFLDSLYTQYGRSYIIPEGDNNAAGIQGSGAIAAYIPLDATLVALAIGTGTTFCGIRQRLAPQCSMLGFPVMKGGDYLLQELSARIPQAGNWQLDSRYHFGGFARHQPGLIDFMNDFYEKYRIPLDFVYTAKMMGGLLDRILNGALPEHRHIIAIHTGGLQGNRSIKDRLCFPLPE